MNPIIKLRDRAECILFDLQPVYDEMNTDDKRFWEKMWNTPLCSGPPVPQIADHEGKLSFAKGEEMKHILLVLFLIISLGCMAQTPAPAPQPSAFPSTTYNFNLNQITLPGAKTSIAGAESDVKIKITQNFALGETTLISGDYTFIGGRGDYVIPQFSKWLQNASPTLNGYQFQLGLTGSIGVTRTPIGAGQSQSHWGQRAGMFLNYSVSGNVGLGLEGQWCNFPGYAHTTYSVAFGPNFHF